MQKRNINTNVVCIHDYFGFYSPSVGGDSSRAFYRSALKCPKPNCWYSNVAVGDNTLASTIKRICERGGLSGYRTNHSLRATAATRMYDKGVDKQLICEKTGKSYKYVDMFSRLFIVLIV